MLFTSRVRTADVLTLARRRILDEPGAERGLQLAGRAPTLAQWPGRVEMLALGLAAALSVAGIACIVAFNWQAMGRWGKFGLAQALLILVFVAALWRGLDSIGGKTLLTMATGLIGPLLALFGQTYQTGADTFELFKGWALLALPWVLASRFAPAWLLWLAIVETALVFYVFAFELWRVLFFGVMPPWLGAVAFNAAILVAWELAARRWHWLAGRTGPRLIAFVLLAMLSVMISLALFGVQSEYFGLTAPLAAWLALLAAGYVYYRRITVDLAMLSMGWLSLTVVLMALMIRLMSAVHAEMAMFLFGALLLLGSGTLGRRWLSGVAAAEPAAVEQPPEQR